MAFSSWGQCLYHPVDRLARDHWPGQYPELVWTPEKTITFLLETVHESSFLRTMRELIFPPRPLNCRRNLWRQILRLLRERGGGVRESGGFLLGRQAGSTRTIEAFLPYDDVDPQALRGIILFDGSRMDVVWERCRRLGLRVVATCIPIPADTAKAASIRPIR